ncbi:N-acetylmuramoyl-L-alanine amidase [Hirschia litorea]|uniref:N-acetylmuramoyl-L-alanine amidase n=2 Tax=Hirschia litorea TaxID=1199156 RepID=A0ABW2ILQ4_9PROT
MLVLHYTGMETGQAALSRMCDPDAKVAAHYMVEEDGRVFQLVDEGKRAWHAGVGSWCGLEDINSRSIGVEIVNGGHDYGLPDFPDVQILAVVKLCKEIVGRHAINADNIIGHSDISPGRKLDPGEKFPWKRLAENEIGLWPVSDEGALSVGHLHMLSDIGYGISEQPDAQEVRDFMVAFQQRWMPENVTGEACVDTLARVFQIADLYRKFRN